MQTILCVRCNSAFQIDETSLTPDISFLRCPKCDEKILLKSENPISLITCPECQHRIPENSSTCFNCGYPIPNRSNSMTSCPECQQSIPKKSKDCPNCGYPLLEQLNLSKTNDAPAYSNASNCLNEGNLEEAKKIIKKALLTYPENIEYEELQIKIDKAIEDKSKSQSLYDQALHLYKRNDFEFASVVIDDAIKLCDDEKFRKLRTEIQSGFEGKKIADMQCIEASNALKKSDFQTGLQLIQKAIELFPESPEYIEVQKQISESLAETQFVEASQALEKSDYPKGLQLIQKAIDLFPENPAYIEVQKQLLQFLAESKFSESKQLYSAKDFKGAQKLINDCLDLLPDDSKYHSERSKIESAIDKKAMRKIGKNILIAAIIIIPAVILIISTLKQNKEKGAWVLADSTKSISAYDKYLAIYPMGKFSSMANTRKRLMKKFDEDAWNGAQNANAIPVYSAFIKNHPFSGYLQQAKDNIQTLNVQKWAGEYYPDQEYSSNENLELEIQRNFQCVLRTNQEEIVGKAEVLGDKLNIYFTTNIEHYIAQGIIYVSSYNSSKPAMILTENEGILLTSLPQSSDEVYNHPHKFFKRKSGYDVSAYQKTQIKEIVQQYYTTYSDKDFEGLTKFFSSSVKRFYSKTNVTKDDIIKLQQEFWNTTDVTQTKSTIIDDSFKVNKDSNGDYVVSFSMNYEVERTNSSKPNLFNIDTYIVLDQAYKIESISEVILSRSRGHQTEQYINSNSNSSRYVIGQQYGGGIIFYVDNSGNHGLIAATSDNRSKYAWNCFGTYVSGTSAAIGRGQANTSAITTAGCAYLSAAGVCQSLVLNGYSDWYLPSKDELDLLYPQKDIIGGFTGTIYWSSSEFNSERAWARGFHDGGSAALMKSSSYSVRAIRTF